MLQELVEEWNKRDCPFRFLKEKTPSEQLQLAQEYNKEKNPSLDASCIIAQIDIGYKTDRIYNENEAKEIMSAYKNCAKNLLEAPKTKTDKDDLEKIDSAYSSLSTSMRNFVTAHKETAEQIISIFNEYTGSARDFWLIETCMVKNPQIWEQGFKAVHKIVDAEEKKAKLQHEKNPELACSENLSTLFTALFDAASEPENIEKIAKEYSSLENNMDKRWLRLIEEEVEGAHCYVDDREVREVFDNYPALMKHILKSSMNKKAINARAEFFGKDDREVEIYTSDYNDPLSADLDTPFALIYKEFKNKYKDKLKTLQVKYKTEKVKAMIPQTAKPKNSALNFDIDLVYAGERRPTIETFEQIVPLTRYNSRWSSNTSKPESGGLWTSPMEKNGKSEWQNFIEREWPKRKEEFAKSWHIVPTEDCRILEIDKFEKIEPYLKYDETIDFIKLSKDYDLLYLPVEVGAWNKTFYSWDVKTGYFMNAVNKEGKPLFQVFDDKEYTRYKIETMKKRAVSSAKKEMPSAKKTKCKTSNSNPKAATLTR